MVRKTQAPTTPQARSQSTASTPATPKPAADDSDSGLTFADIYRAILEQAAQQQSQQEAEEFKRALIAELQRRKREEEEEAAAQMLLQQIAQAQRAQEQQENLQALAQLGLLQAFLSGAYER